MILTCIILKIKAQLNQLVNWKLWVALFYPEQWVEFGSFENEALENKDRSTKHPNLENEAPKSRKRSTQNSKPL